MNIDKEIFEQLLDNADGNMSKIKGLSQMTLIQMKKGKARTQFSKLMQVLFDNGFKEMTLKSDNTFMTFCVENKSVSVVTKRIKDIEVNN